MNETIREQLIGYVLGALDESEQHYVEQQLERDPLWQEELACVQQQLEPLADAYDEYEPPRDLVAKTCKFVAEESERLQTVRPMRPESALEGGFETRSRWRLADWVVMGGICLAAAALFFPAILNSRFSARMIACQDNLRQLGMALTQFSDATHERFFPIVPASGNQSYAGVYASQLKDAGLLSHASLVLCPESRECREWEDFRVPALMEIEAADGDQILLLQQRGGGTYAYTLGFVLNGQLMPTRNLSRSQFVLMSDVPTLSWGRGSAHGHGLNVLFEDMHVRFVCDTQEVRQIDNPFCNRYGRLEAGCDVDDSVVAPSHYPPLMTNVSNRNVRQAP